jgi:hypothetical protein
MKIKKIDTPDHTKFTLRLPTELLIWFRQQAKIERRKITGEMVLALEAWRAATDISLGETKKDRRISEED